MQDKNLQLSARDKVVQKMSRDGAVENNISAASSHRISNRLMDATLKTEVTPDNEFGGRAKHSGKLTTGKRHRRPVAQNEVHGIKTSGEENRLDALLSQVTGNDNYSSGLSYSENMQRQDNDAPDTDDGVMETSDAADNIQVSSEINSRLSEHKSALSVSRISDTAGVDGNSGVRLKTDRNKRIEKRKLLEKYHAGDENAPNPEHGTTGIKSEAGINLGNSVKDVKPEAGIKKEKQKKSRLKFDDQLKDEAGNEIGERVGKKEKHNAAPLMFETTKAAGNVVRDGVHASDVSDEEDNSASSDVVSAAKGTAERGLVYQKKYEGRLKFKAEDGVGEHGRLSAKKEAGRSKVLNTDKASDVPVQKGKAKNKHIQKKRLKKEYATAYKNAKNGKETGKNVSTALKGTAEKAKQAAVAVVRNHPAVAAGVAIFLVFSILISSLAGTAGAMASELGGAVTESTYLSSDNDILAANTSYEDMEKELQDQVDNIESTYPGYDEYRYQVDEITHDPYALTSYLTAMYGNYKSANLSDDLLDLFREQFHLELSESVETRTRTVTNDDGTESEEEYEVTILNVNVTNKGLDTIASEHLGENQKKLYAIYQASLGNRSYLFGDSITIGNVADGGMRYEIPADALNDEQFANMIGEAEKYLGYPYVWGGSNPSSSFDCSGFVSYVINNCGNGWNVGRQTANGLRSQCTYVSASEAKPGDLIFFQKTYNTTGASHVGIYVGNGMMIHCGNPIQYTSINSNYWQQHFLAFGRL